MEANWVVKDVNTGTFWSAATGASCALIFTADIAKARRMTRRAARTTANKMGEGFEAVQ